LAYTFCRAESCEALRRSTRVHHRRRCDLSPRGSSTMKEFPRKFLSLRDKNGSHRRSKSVPPGNKDSKVRESEHHIAECLPGLPMAALGATVVHPGSSASCPEYPAPTSKLKTLKRE
jgi:hypothetical protein